jgi:hypothetical protein
MTSKAQVTSGWDSVFQIITGKVDITTASRRPGQLDGKRATRRRGRVLEKPIAGANKLGFYGQCAGERKTVEQGRTQAPGQHRTGYSLKPKPLNEQC